MAGMTRYASVLGLGFGDCGKGLFVDALTRRWGAHTVVRFSGGAQAGHNVVAPANSPASGLHHTFSQFGAGTLVPGCSESGAVDHHRAQRQAHQVDGRQRGLQ